MFQRNSLPFRSPGEVFCKGSKGVHDQSGNSKRGYDDGKGKRDSRNDAEEEDKVFVCARTRCKCHKAKILAEGYKLLYSNESPVSRNGVGAILHRELQEEVCEVNRVNDTIMYVKMMFGREIVTVLTAYASEAGCSEDEKEKFWRDLDGVMVGIPENERVIVGGDLNGHAGGRKGGEEMWHG
ncbi:uncharacterized protein LOC126355295 [Schistocerca gregaria]|uniref:uncharacterized protein LOC126355295 n=1 Tax=Schistocerca gregaria TaxID=7010 RepID=UPI00211F3414|nr:uncharacterized protein LOC126355295 [Schistocerca gregaria]